MTYQQVTTQFADIISRHGLEGKPKYLVIEHIQMYNPTFRKTGLGKYSI